MYLADSLHRNVVAVATSWASPMRPMGTLCWVILRKTARSSSLSLSPSFSTSGVSMRPGTTQLTLMFLGAYMQPDALVNLRDGRQLHATHNIGMDHGGMPYCTTAALAAA